MAQGTRESDYVYIQLDEPTPWWASVVGGIAVVLIVAVLVAPWAIDWDNETPATVPNTTQQASNSLCRPNNSGLPGLLDPPVASWNRFCEWFIDPSSDNP